MDFKIQLIYFNQIALSFQPCHTLKSAAETLSTTQIVNTLFKISTTLFSQDWPALADGSEATVISWDVRQDAGKTGPIRQWGEVITAHMESPGYP